MPIVGKIVGSGMAATGSGRTVPFQMVRPERQNRENLAVIAANMVRWREQTSKFSGPGLDSEVRRRGQFALDTLAWAGEVLRWDDRAHMIYPSEVTFAVTGRDDITGLVIYNVTRTSDLSWRGFIELMAVSPENLPGSPGNDQLRGIGTSLVAAISRYFLEEGATSVCLHPLDLDAQKFWQARGFLGGGPVMPGGLMPELCITGKAGISALIGSCDLARDCPDKGECVQCGVKTGNKARKPVGMHR